MRTKHHRLAIALLVPALGWLAGCGGAHPQPTATEVVAVRAERLPEDPGDPAWRQAPAFRAELMLQDLVEPRLLVPSTPSLLVRALTDGQSVAFHLSWDDATADDLAKAAAFSDACAVQLPQTTEVDAPDPQMGNPGRPVEITLWRASWQAWVDGRKDEIRSIHPNAAIDHYPFEAPSLVAGSEAQREMALRYAPARRLGNVMEGPRERPVEDLLGQGPGTLEPLAEQRSRGRGGRTATGWQVVIVRPLPLRLAPGGRSEIAFAIWAGENREAGARKMRSVWVPLSVEGGA
jgi:DMSO reductase family type II enzyme heme b subunit